MNFCKIIILKYVWYGHICADKISQEAYKCTHRADLPVQGTFQLLIAIVSLEDKCNIKNTA